MLSGIEFSACPHEIWWLFIDHCCLGLICIKKKSQTLWWLQCCMVLQPQYWLADYQATPIKCSVEWNFLHLPMKFDCFSLAIATWNLSGRRVTIFADCNAVWFCSHNIGLQIIKTNQSNPQWNGIFSISPWNLIAFHWLFLLGTHLCQKKSHNLLTGIMFGFIGTILTFR